MHESFVLHIVIFFWRKIFCYLMFTILFFVLFCFGSSHFVEWQGSKGLVIWEQDVFIDEKFYMVNPQMVQILVVITTMYNTSTQNT